MQQQELLAGFVRLPILPHAGEGAIYGQRRIEMRELLGKILAKP